MPGTRRVYQRPRLRSLPPLCREERRAAHLRELAYAFLEAGNPEGAVEILRGALVLDPVAPAGRISMALALYHSGAFEIALAWLTPLSGQRNAEAEFLRGRILADLRRREPALEAFALALEADPSLFQARLNRAALFLSANDLLQALREIEEVLKENPTECQALLLRATARMETGEAEQALADLEAIPEEGRSVECLLLRARALLLSGRPDPEVDDTFERGRRRFPTDIRLPLSYARHLGARRAVDPEAHRRAVSLVEELITEEREPPLSPANEAEACFLLAELVAQTNEGPERAEALFQRGLALRPDDPEGLAGLGALQLGIGRASHAVPWLLRSLLLDPERPRTIEFLARALCAIDDDEAVARWLGLLVAGLPRDAPPLLAQLLRFVQESGRTDAYEDLRREGHRMKNLVAVLGSRFGSSTNPELGRALDELYREWSNFLARIRSLPLAPVLLSPAKVIQRAVAEASGDVRRIHCLVPLHLPLLKGDEEALSGALANILRNALEASPKDGMVRISARAREGGRFLEVAVTDRGPGIALSDQRRLFDPGFTRKEGGSGVGLTIARRAVMAHGGRISVASGPGGPTTFIVRLPAVSWSSPGFLREVLHAG